MAPTGKGPLRIAIDDFFSTTRVGIWLASWWSDLIESVETSILGEYRAVFDRVSSIPAVEQWLGLRKVLQKQGIHQGAGLTLLGFGLNLGMGAASAFLAPIMRLINYEMDKQIHSARLDPSQIIPIRWRSYTDPRLFDTDLLELGYDAQRINWLDLVMRPRVSNGELIADMLRGGHTLDYVKHELEGRGYLPSDIDTMISLSHQIPSVSDLISMAVREAWNDQVASRFAYDSGLPTEAQSWAAKQGLDPDWFRRYWRAHWQLPSPSQGYEMLHRLRPGESSIPFTTDDMRLMLQTADYPEFFRERLIAISYAPYTRVDVRRMYKLGVLTEEDLIHTYMDLGYDRDHASKLAEFTVKYETAGDETKPEKARDLNQGTIIDAYSKQVITRERAKELLSQLLYDDDECEIILKASEFKQVVDLKPDYKKEFVSDLRGLVEKAYAARMLSKSEATTMLANLGYVQGEIDMILQVSDFNYDKSVLSDTLKLIGDGYINHTLTYADAVTLLGKYNVSGAQQTSLFSEWELQRSIRNRPLTEAQYRAAAIAGFISIPEYVDALQGLGYADKSIDILVKILNDKIGVE